MFSTEQQGTNNWEEQLCLIKPTGYSEELHYWILLKVKEAPKYNVSSKVVCSPSGFELFL